MQPVCLMRNHAGCEHVPGVVATDERPSRIRARVLVRLMEQVAVEKKCVARLHLDEVPGQHRQCSLHTHRVCLLLALWSAVVLSQTDRMRARDDLQAAILSRRVGDSDHARPHLRKEDPTCVVPIAEILRAPTDLSVTTGRRAEVKRLLDAANQWDITRLASAAPGAI